MENKKDRFVVDFGLSCKKHKGTLLLTFSGNILSSPERRATVLRATICIFHEKYGMKVFSEVKKVFFLSALSGVLITLATVGR